MPSLTPAVQEAVVKKLVAEVNAFDNLDFEVCNEPYFGGVTDDWQRRIVDVIVDAEKDVKEAMNWYRKAAMQNHTAAAEALKRLEKKP